MHVREFRDSIADAGVGAQDRGIAALFAQDDAVGLAGNDASRHLQVTAFDAGDQVEVAPVHAVSGLLRGGVGVIDHPEVEVVDADLAYGEDILQILFLLLFGRGEAEYPGEIGRVFLAWFHDEGETGVFHLRLSQLDALLGEEALEGEAGGDGLCVEQSVLGNIGVTLPRMIVDDGQVLDYHTAERHEGEVRKLHASVHVLFKGPDDAAGERRLCCRDLQHQDGGQQQRHEDDQDAGDYFQCLFDMGAVFLTYKFSKLFG